MSKDIIDIEYNWIVLVVKDCMGRKQKTPRLGLVVTKKRGAGCNTVTTNPYYVTTNPNLLFKILKWQLSFNNIEVD